MTVDTAELQDRTYYDVLGLPVSPKHVTLREIKAAYHRALLTAHPDKVLGASGAELDLVRKAFSVLSDDVLRKEYDAKIKGTFLSACDLIIVGSVTKNAFVSIDLDDMTYDEESATYSFACRCGTGGGFAITEDDLERGRDLVECRGCSSWIRVSYEMVTE